MAINIQLTKKFKMKSNNRCLQLCTNRIAGPEAINAGEQTETSIADCTSFDSFFRAYVQHSLLEASDENGMDITNFRDLMTEMDQVLDQIKQIVNFDDIVGDKTTKELIEHVEEKQQAPDLLKKMRRRKKR